MEGRGGQLGACRLGASEPAPLPDVAIIFGQSGQHWAPLEHARNPASRICRLLGGGNTDVQYGDM
jgi:hypothetical protein